MPIPINFTLDKLAHKATAATDYYITNNTGQYISIRAHAEQNSGVDIELLFKTDYTKSWNFEDKEYAHKMGEQIYPALKNKNAAPNKLAMGGSVYLKVQDTQVKKRKFDISFSAVDLLSLLPAGVMLNWGKKYILTIQDGKNTYWKTNTLTIVQSQDPKKTMKLLQKIGDVEYTWITHENRYEYELKDGDNTTLYWFQFKSDNTFIGDNNVSGTYLLEEPEENVKDNYIDFIGGNFVLKKSSDNSVVENSIIASKEYLQDCNYNGTNDFDAVELTKAAWNKVKKLMINDVPQ